MNTLNFWIVAASILFHFTHRWKKLSKMTRFIFRRFMSLKIIPDTFLKSIPENRDDKQLTDWSTLGDSFEGSFFVKVVFMDCDDVMTQVKLELELRRLLSFKTNKFITWLSPYIRKIKLQFLSAAFFKSVFSFFKIKKKLKKHVKSIFYFIKIIQKFEISIFSEITLIIMNILRNKIKKMSDKVLILPLLPNVKLPLYCYIF